MTVRRSATVFVLLVLGTSPARGDDKDLVRLDSQMEALQDETGRMQRSFDEHTNEMGRLVAKNADATSRMTSALVNLRAALEKHAAKSSEDVEELSGLGQALNDGLDQSRERLAKATTRLDVKYPVRINVRPQTASAGVLQDAVYDRALRDFNQGKNDIASTEFSTCVESHPGTDLAGTSYFYLGEIQYRRNDYGKAIAYYELALTTFPGGSKAAAAHLKKGAAFVHLGLTDDGVREFNRVIKQYPGSNEAALAKKVIAKLRALAP